MINLEKIKIMISKTKLIKTVETKLKCKTLQRTIKIKVNRNKNHVEGVIKNHNQNKKHQNKDSTNNHTKNKKNENSFSH